MPVVKKQTRKPIVGKASKANGVVGRIAPVSYHERKDAINIYGPSGSGKTTLACDWPKPLLLIGAEDGTRSVYNLKGVDFVRLEHTTEMPKLIEHIRESKYETVVLDTATSFQAMTLKEILGLEELPAQKSWGMASRDQYGQSALQTKEVLRQILRLAEENVCHTLILAQERRFESETHADLIAPEVMASLTGSTVGWLNPECDYIMQTFKRQAMEEKDFTIGKKVTTRKVATEGVEYCLRVGPHPVYLTKFRTPKGRELPDILVDPDYGKITSLMAGE